MTDVGGPLAMVVRCQGADHTITWEDGIVGLSHHPDIDAELALIAFGGDEAPCLALHRLWTDAVADGGFLGEWVDEGKLGPARLSWLATALERMRTEGYHEFLRHLPPARAHRMGLFLHTFPRPWLDRAAAAVSVAVSDQQGAGPVVCDHAEGLLAEAVAVRVRRAFVDAVGGRQLSVGAAALVPLDIRVTVGSPPSVAGSLTGPDKGVVIEVDRSWLHRVWARDAAVVGGRLTIDVGGWAQGPMAAPTDERPTLTQVEWVPSDRSPPALGPRLVSTVDDRDYG